METTTTDLVQVINNQSVTTSRMIAEYFEKQHKHVLESIRELIANMKNHSAEKWAQCFFQETSYVDSSGKSNVEYLMNRDGFSLLVMGFNNTEKVLKWKLKFIEAFNRMEEQIKQQQIQQSQAYPVQPGLAQAIISAGQTANALQMFFNVSPGIARVHALTLAEEEYAVDLNTVKQLLPPINDTVSTINPTEIALHLTENTNTKYTARQINQILNEMNLQHKTGKEWELTEEGKQYGSMFPYERNGHTGYQLKWKTEIIEMIKNHLQTQK